MAKIFAGPSDGQVLIFLLNVRMKRVEMQLERRAADIRNQLKPLLDSVEEVSFKPVQRFHADQFPALVRIAGNNFEIIHNSFPLSLSFSGSECLRPAQIRINWSA